ncbi:hypothetical protein PG994_003344 [Apiospora phragmitis]|uniref:Ankyrin n=1 Tax=Apiospora phragmitis TaxID=2905665 RepID=A0ABR1VZ41_9PEZI
MGGWGEGRGGRFLTWPHSRSLHSSHHFAALYGHTAVLQLFESYDAEEGTDLIKMLSMNSNFKGLPEQNLGDALRRINPDIDTFVPSGYMLRPFVLNGLGIAILRGHAEAAEYLAQFHDESRIDELEFDEDGWLKAPDFTAITHPLHLACFMGMERVVKILLDKGADVSAICAPVQWSTPLMWAVARRENEEIIRLLLEKGADPKIRDRQNRSPLEWALQFGGTANACLMVEEGAPVDIWLWSGESCCALTLSMESDGHWDCTQAIFQKYPDLPEVFLKKCVHSIFQWATYTDGGVKTLRWCMKENIGIDPLYEAEVDGDPYSYSYKENDFGMSAVHYAAAMDALPIDVLASALEKRPQDINRASEKGKTPLSLAFGNGYYSRRRYDSEQVAFLLTKGADPKGCPTEKQRTVLAAVQASQPKTEIEEIIKSFRTPNEIESDESWARIKAEEAAFMSEAAQRGITPKQAEFLHKKRVPLTVVNGLRSFGWSVDDIIRRACKWRRGEGEARVEEELERLVEEEKNGLRQRVEWDVGKTAPVTSDLGS